MRMEMKKVRQSARRTAITTKKKINQQIHIYIVRKLLLTAITIEVYQRFNERYFTIFVMYL